MAEKKTPTKKERIPKYKDEEGSYLVVEGYGYEFTLVWYDPVEKDLGLVLANEVIDSLLSIDTNTASDECRKYFEEKKFELPAARQEYVFPTQKMARECLRRINHALYLWKKGVKIEEWEQKALNAGWTPPKGWAKS